MEDVAGCSLTGLMYPEDRVHLHENNPDTIHIHDEWVSWGHFFANNGFVFDENTLATNQSQVFTTNDTDKLVYVLNGNIVENPFNMLITSKDRLLITYGWESEQEIQERFAQVSDNAWEYNDRYDPGSCWGTNENAIAVLISDFFWDKH